MASALASTVVSGGSLFDFMVPASNDTIGSYVKPYARVKTDDYKPKPDSRGGAFRGVRNLVSQLEKNTFTSTGKQNTNKSGDNSGSNVKHEDTPSPKAVINEHTTSSAFFGGPVMGGRRSPENPVYSPMTSDDDYSPMVSDDDYSPTTIDVVSPVIPEDARDCVISGLPEMLDDTPIVSPSKPKQTSTKTKKNNRAHEISKMFVHLSKAFEILGNLAEN